MSTKKTPDEIDHTILGFGKYRDYTPAEIAEFDTGYILWLREKVVNRGTLMSDVLYTECVKNPTRPSAHRRIPPPGALKSRGPQVGSVAESRSHFDSSDENDDAPF